MADFTSPPTPCPSHTSSPSQTGWHFPGPSSKYHQRERPKQTRFAKSSYTPVAPFLSTELRAHRRSQSAQLLSKGLPTPPSSEHSRSPLTRFSSCTIPTMSMPGPGLMTPAKERSHSQFDARLQDSPFSDYFTDDARSIEYTTSGASYDAPSTETQQLLVRLSKLQAHLMRAGDSEQDALNIVERKIGEIDDELNALHSQTRRPAELDDSGLFSDVESPLEKAGASARQDSAASGHTGLDGTCDIPEEPECTPESKQAELDYQVVEAQRVLENVTKAQEELRKRHAELVELNDDYASQIADHEQEIEQLRSENETLKSDLGFDHSELLFLKLQMKALQVEVESLEDDDPAGKRAERGRIMEEMDRWRSDWHDVERRVKRRSSRHRSVSAGDEGDTLEQSLAGDSGDWQLETIKKRPHGRVSSITIRRLEDEERPMALDGAADAGQAKVMLAERGCQTTTAKAPKYAEQSCQLDTAEISGCSEQGCQTEDQGVTAEYAEQSCQTDKPQPSPADHSCQSDPPRAPDYSHRGCQPDDSHLTTTRASQSCQTDAPKPASASEHADQSTQTHTMFPPPTTFEESLLSSHDQSTECGDYDGYASDDCAITTSASTPELSPVITPQQKSAWAELWEGLGQLAGLGEE